jgi:hypothetical protein
MKKKRRDFTYIDAQEVLARVKAGNAPASWRIFHTSRKKVFALISGFVAFIVLFICGFAVFLFGHVVRIPPIPADAVSGLFICMLVVFLLCVLCSIIIWMSMKNIILILLPQGFVHGDSRKPKRALCVSYQDIEELYASGNGLAFTLKSDTWKKRQMDLSWFTSSRQEVATSFIEQYKAFKANQTREGQKLSKWQEGVPSGPAEIDQAAQEAQWGVLVRVFPPDEQAGRADLQISLTLFCVGGIGFLTSIVFLLVSHLTWFALWIVPIISGTLLIAPLRNLNGLWIWKKGGRSSIYLYEHGLIASFLWQEKQYLNLVAWGQVIAVWPTGTRAQGCLISYEEAPGQETFLLITGSIKDCALLTREIQRQVARVKLPGYLADFARNKICSFAFLLGESESKVLTREGCRVTEYGLLYKRHYIPWRDLASIELQGTKGVITPRSGSASSKMSFSVHEIANTYALVE